MEFTQKLGAAASAVALSLGGVAGAQDAVQWRVEDGGNGHWYQCLVRDEPMSHATARQFATSRGAQLASLCGSEFDFAVLSTGALQPGSWQQSDSSQWIGPWIGLELSEEGWTWTDGSACKFDRWDAGLGQPNTLSAPGEPFAFLYAIGQGPAPHVHDVPATMTSRSAIIEWSADCNNDGVVDYGQIRAGQLADSNGNGVPDGCEPDGSNPSDAAQWSTIIGGNGHWYAVIPNSAERRSWDACSLYCQQRGGHLVSILSAAENNWVASFALQFNWAWVDHPDGFGPFLGGRQIDGT